MESRIGKTTVFSQPLDQSPAGRPDYPNTGKKQKNRYRNQQFDYIHDYPPFFKACFLFPVIYNNIKIMTIKPFFSIIIPTFNRKSFLRIALDSCLQQTFDGYEIIVIDDGSNDGTKKMVAGLNHKKISYSYQKNQGPAAARNNGIKKAKGKFICFLDSDDRFRKQKLETTYDYIQKHPGYKVFHSQEIWYRNGRLLSAKKYHQKPNGWVFPAAVKLCCLSPSAITLKKDIFGKIGYFDEKLLACEDYDFFLRLSLTYPVFLIPEYLTLKEGGHPDQQSKKYPAMDEFRIYALKKILKSKDLNDENYRLAYQELKQKCTIYIKGALKRNKLKQADGYKQIIANYQR